MEFFLLVFVLSFLLPAYGLFANTISPVLCALDLPPGAAGGDLALITETDAVSGVGLVVARNGLSVKSPNATEDWGVLWLIPDLIGIGDTDLEPPPAEAVVFPLGDSSAPVANIGLEVKEVSPSTFCPFLRVAPPNPNLRNRFVPDDLPLAEGNGDVVLVRSGLPANSTPSREAVGVEAALTEFVPPPLPTSPGTGALTAAEADARGAPLEASILDALDRSSTARSILATF